MEQEGISEHWGVLKASLFGARENNLLNFILTKGAADLRLVKGVISPDVGWHVGSQSQIWLMIHPQHSGDGGSESKLGLLLNGEGQLTTWRTREWGHARWNVSVLPSKHSFAEREDISSGFHGGQCSFASRRASLRLFEARAASYQAIRCRSRAHGCFCSLGAIRGTRKPCLEKTAPAREMAHDKCMVVFRNRGKSYKVPEKMLVV